MFNADLILCLYELTEAILTYWHKTRQVYNGWVFICVMFKQKVFSLKIAV